MNASRPNQAPWAWALAGALAGLLVATILQAPARWLTAALQQLSQDRVVFQQVRGTVWQGSAQISLAGGLGSQDAATLPGRLSWQLHPGVSALRADLMADCCMQRPWQISLQPALTGARLVVADSLSQWPAQWLTGLGAPWNTVQPEGQLSLTTQAFSMAWTSGRAVMAGRVQLDATGMSSRLSTIKPMGSYRVSLQGGAAPGFTLETLEGSLKLSGTGQWVGARLRFEGVATAEPDRLEALSNLLNILGRRDGARSLIKLG
jgi:general secretion pathway protein N